MDELKLPLTPFVDKDAKSFFDKINEKIGLLYLHEVLKRDKNE